MEAQNDDVTLEQTDSNTGQLNDGRQPISFEIHEESMDNRLQTDQPMTARFGTWSTNASCSRSHYILLLVFFIHSIRIFL